MANPIAFAAALAARTRTLTCPFCKHKKLADRAPKTFRVCPRCHKHFPDPLAKKSRK
jgi:transposase-like protein